MLYPFEALAEISRFVAGLVQRVLKKTNEVKFDLLNSTASQGDCNWENFVVFGCGSSLLPLYPPPPVILSGDGTSESKDLYNENLKEDRHTELGIFG